MSLTAAMCDSREPAHILALRFGGVPVSPVMLDCGDLWASCDDGSLLIVERKTPGDLLNSIKDGRLFQQCAAMRQRSQWAYLIVTGILASSLDGHVLANGRASGWRWADVQGALLTVQDLGVAVLYCDGDEQYEDTVLRLARRERTAEKVLAPRTQGRVLTPAEQILTSLPGIGLERAQSILEEYEGHCAHGLAWLTWTGTVAEVAGIGDGIKNQVRRALGLEADEWLTVFSPIATDYATQQMDGTVVGVQAEAGTQDPTGGGGGSEPHESPNGAAVQELQVSLL